MTNYPISNVTASVKLVIWDLDETFWQGTLSEGGMTSIARNASVVRELLDRGIMSSICSKNDFETAKAELVRLGIWDCFVFPHIDWTPKGQAIKSMIAAMGLRDENVLFLDDNHMNLEEAQFFNARLMCVDGTLDMTGLLELPQFKGKDDRAHSRLAQYRVMETKHREHASGGLSNEDFLRQSEIKIRINTDIDANMDRVLELLNRTNQLNFTKIRANTKNEREALTELLNVSGMHAGLVEARDRYGDYGMVGFFCVRTKYSGTIVHHMAFSCRTLNMGVEQWVWEYLGRPDFKPVGPVANPIDSFPKVDWISQVDSFEDGAAVAPDRRLCLVGGCDLLQVSFYCGTNRDEFVNTQNENGFLVRYDDIGFFLNPRPEMRHNRIMQRLPSCSYQDMKSLDTSLAESDVVLLSMYFSVPADNLFTYGGEGFGGKYWINVPIRTLKKLMKDPDTALWFAKTMYLRRLPLEERLDLTQRCFDHAIDRKKPGAQLFILSAATKHGKQAERTRPMREAYNDMCREFCNRHDETHFVDIDTLLNAEEFADSDHYTRTGYYKIAEFVNTHAAPEEPLLLTQAMAGE